MKELQITQVQGGYIVRYSADGQHAIAVYTSLDAFANDFNGFFEPAKQVFPDEQKQQEQAKS